MSRIIIISGATSSGKSGLALEFASKFLNKQKCAIINADSLQIYQGLEILSAQPTKEEQGQIPHFLYSHLKASDNCNVTKWLGLVKNITNNLEQENILPIIVGGSGMYISALVEGISQIPQIDDNVRQVATNYFNEFGLIKLQQKLIDLGEKKILDKQRLIRAYEVYLQTGKLISDFHSQQKQKFFDKAKFIHINLEIPRSKLYQNCNLRFEQMLKNGAIDEVKDLRAKITNNNYQITKTLGYHEICQFLDHKITKQEMIAIATQKTRNYAKRQLTYFRNQLPQKQVFNDQEKAINYLNEIL